MALGDYNLYDFVAFPKREIRDKARNEYFNVHKLLGLDTSEYNKNNPIPPNKSILEQKATVTLFDILDKGLEDSFDEIIRRINNQLSLTDLTIMSLYNYYNEMQKYSIDEEQYVLNETLYRYECMHACYNYFNIQEKYKTIIRVLYGLDPKETGKNNEFLDAIKKIKGKDQYLNNFYAVCKDIANNQDYKFVIDIRNDETHNIPCLDKVCFQKKDKNGVYFGGGVYFVIDNESLYDGIKGAYIALISLNNAVQDIIDNFKK